MIITKFTHCPVTKYLSNILALWLYEYLHSRFILLIQSKILPDSWGTFAEYSQDKTRFLVGLESGWDDAVVSWFESMSSTHFSAVYVTRGRGCSTVTVKVPFVQFLIRWLNLYQTMKVSDPVQISLYLSKDFSIQLQWMPVAGMFPKHKMYLFYAV